MIYTLTFSPSIDYYLTVNRFKENSINRSTMEEFAIGGKGINVTKVLKELNVNSIAIGFISGFTGEYLKECLKKENVESYLINASGSTRINVKILSEHETAINSNSLIIDNEALNILYKKISEIKEGDYLIISGSVPPHIDLEDIVKKIKKQVKVIIDVDYNIIPLLKYHPFLIKPNRDELYKLVNKEANDLNEIILFAKELKKQGAQNVIVSLDKDGAIMIDEQNNEYYRKNKKLNVVSTVGAGDSMVAGFIFGSIHNYSMEKSFELGMHCAAAACLTKALPNKMLIDKIKESK